MEKLNQLVELAKKATPGRNPDRLESCGGGIKYQCLGDDGSLVLQCDHKNDEYGFIGPKSLEDEAFFLACKPDTILAIAEAFRALEQRAETAEAKLAELESNPLIDHLEKCSAIVSAWPEWKKQGADASKFTRPAPAADLAALVPDKMTWNQAHSLLDINQCGEDRFSAFMMGYNYNRAEVLRNIEEAK